MKTNELENILLCPVTQKPLRVLSADALDELMQRLAAKELVSQTEVSLKRSFSGALQVVGQERYYPIMDGIIGLLPDCAIVPPQALRLRLNDVNITQKAVQDFYDALGWQMDGGVFKDAKDSEDLRDVSKQYRQACHERLNRFLPQTGDYLLDVASGPIQYDAYLNYSKNFRYRICADISMQALVQAQKKLGNKGLYLLCDVTKLPLQSDKIDAIVSLHTLYHVPKDKQECAFFELYRVLKPRGVSLIVYSWGRHSLLMAGTLLPFKLGSLFKRWWRKQNASTQTLYFHAYPYRELQSRVIKKYNAMVVSWRSVNVPFLKIYIHRFLGGAAILKAIYLLEEAFPRLMGRFGAYPLLISRKP